MYVRSSLAMMQYRHLFFVLLWVVISVEGGFATVRHRDDWHNWIILQARSRTSDRSGSVNSFSAIRVNQSGVAQGYVDPVQIEPYIVTISGRSDDKKAQESVVMEDKVDGASGNDLVVPIGRAFGIVKEICGMFKELFTDFTSNEVESDGRAKPSSTSRKIKKKVKKKFKKFIMPLLLAYKLKFLTLVPVLIGGLLLLVGTTGLAGFFFALFTAVMSLKGDPKMEFKQW